MNWDETMANYPCPYPTVEDLRQKRASHRGLAFCGGAATDKDTDAVFVAEWHQKYAAAEAKRRKLGLPSPVAKIALPDLPKRASQPKPPPVRIRPLPPPEERPQSVFDEMMERAEAEEAGR